MISAQVAQQIRQIQIRTSKILSGAMLGAGRTTYKGAGFDFDQVREYAQGDDLRFIDWKSTARSGKLLTKQYFEDRNYNILIALDISSSVFAGGKTTKFDVLAQLAAIFTLVAQHRKDQVGLILFADQIVYELPIKNGKAHVFKVLSAIFEQANSTKSEFVKTNLAQVLGSIAKNLKQKSLIVLISDFIDDQSDYQKVLKQLQYRHHVLAVRYLDCYEQQMPNLGILPVVDPETGETGFLDTRFAKNKKSMLNLAIKNRLEQQNLLLRSCGVDILQINHDAQPVLEVVKFFSKRLRY